MKAGPSSSFKCEVVWDERQPPRTFVPYVPLPIDPICEFSYWHPKQQTPALRPKQSMTEYEGRHAALVAYLRVKADQADWHGVSDAANDLRVLEAEHSVRSQCDLGKYAPIIEQLRERQSR